jgi:hypothetical protein
VNRSRPEAEKREVIYFDVDMMVLLDLAPTVMEFSPLSIFPSTILCCSPVYQLSGFVPPVDIDWSGYGYC